MTVKERVQAAHPAIFGFFVAAEQVGYRPDWHNTQNLTLYYDRMLRPRDRLLGGWNSGKEQEWYIAVRHLHGANASLAEELHFVRRPRDSSGREVCTLGGAENLPSFQAVIEQITGVRIRP